MSKKIESRQECNRELLVILSKLVEENPHLRFGQILQVAGFITFETGTAWRNEFYIEPFDLLTRVREGANKLRLMKVFPQD